jgi:hypothetical protein
VGWVGKESVEVCGAGSEEQRAVRAGKYGGHLGSQWRGGRRDEVDAAPEGPEAPRFRSVVDRIPAHAEAKELCPRDQAVLARSNPHQLTLDADSAANSATVNPMAAVAGLTVHMTVNPAIPTGAPTVAELAASSRALPAPQGRRACGGAPTPTQPCTAGAAAAAPGVSRLVAVFLDLEIQAGPAGAGIDAVPGEPPSHRPRQSRLGAMGLADRLRRIWGVAGGAPRPDGLDELQVGDAAYDDWDIVRDFGDLETGRAFRQSLTDQGVDAVLTADWPLDQWGRGDISLRVPPGAGAEAEDLLDSE